MISRKQVFLRSLAAGVLAGLGVSSYLIWKQRSAPPPPQHPITLPEAVAWANHSITKMPDGSEHAFIEAFVGDGKNFRLEVALAGKPPVVWVYDGHDLAINVKVPDRPVSEIDPRNTVLSAYNSLPGFRYLGVHEVGQHECWAFERKDEGFESRFWIDVTTHVPRQVILQYPDGRRDTQTYVDLPAHRTHQPGLFDRANLNAMLMPSAEAMLGN